MENEKILIKKMTKLDINDILVVDKKSFSTPWTKEMFEGEFKHDNVHYFVIMVDGKIVGYIGAWYVIDEVQITNVCIDPDYRRKGLGIKLVEKLVEHAEELGMMKMTLEVRETNVSAIKLYEKIGFVSEGVRKNFYVKPVENAIIMWKTLKGVEEI